MPPSPASEKIFGFAEFIAALALLVIVFTTSDVRHRFRVSVAPLPLLRYTFIGAALIGSTSLATDVWRVSKWWVLKTEWLTYSTWQALVGLFFLVLVLSWMWYAYVRPPVFSRRNAKRFAGTLHGYIVKGAEEDLRVIADELQRSARSIIVEAAQAAREFAAQNSATGVSEHRRYAYDLTSLLGNRRLCRCVVLSAPSTAIEFFDAIAASKAYDLPTDAFIRNIASEAVIQSDSMLREEVQETNRTLIGHLKSFTKSVFANVELVEGLKGTSPFDIVPFDQSTWDHQALGAYTAVLLEFLERKLAGNWRNSHSFVLSRAFHALGRGTLSGSWGLNEVTEISWEHPRYQRLRILVEFARKAVDAVQRAPTLPEYKSRAPKLVGHRHFPDVYALIAGLMFEIVESASEVRAPRMTAWQIQHNDVWGEFFSFGDGQAWRRVRHELCKLIGSQVSRMFERPNYRGARLAGYVLNVEGLQGDDKSSDRAKRALARLARSWARTRYLPLTSTHPNLAEAVLTGSLSFDSTPPRLVKTYEKGLSREAPKEYLDLK